MEQVAEWQHNTTAIEGQIKILKDINGYIAECCPKMNGQNIYWSVENNTVGEAALVVIKNEQNVNYIPSSGNKTTRYRQFRGRS
jgi:hypothetical protein